MTLKWKTKREGKADILYQVGLFYRHRDGKSAAAAAAACFRTMPTHPPPVSVLISHRRLTIDDNGGANDKNRYLFIKHLRAD